MKGDEALAKQIEEIAPAETARAGAVDEVAGEAHRNRHSRDSLLHRRADGCVRDDYAGSRDGSDCNVTQSRAQQQAAYTALMAKWTAVKARTASKKP